MAGAAERRDLFNSIVAASGLSVIFAPGTVRRALADAGYEVRDADVQAFRRSLPSLEARLKAYLDAAEVGDAMKRIQAAIDGADVIGVKIGVRS